MTGSIGARNAGIGGRPGAQVDGGGDEIEELRQQMAMRAAAGIGPQVEIPGRGPGPTMRGGDRRGAQGLLAQNTMQPRLEAAPQPVARGLQGTQSAQDELAETEAKELIEKMRERGYLPKAPAPVDQKMFDAALKQMLADAEGLDGETPCDLEELLAKVESQMQRQERKRGIGSALPNGGACAGGGGGSCGGGGGGGSCAGGAGGSERAGATGAGGETSGTSAPGGAQDQADPGPAEPGVDKNATFDKVHNKGGMQQMVEGRITVNGNTYNFRSGGHGRGSLPPGEYTVSNLRQRDTRGMVVGGVGYSADLSDKYDSRVGDTRSALRIHPDGGSAGTNGCIGIVGSAETQRRFQRDLQAELQKNGGRFTLKVG